MVAAPSPRVYDDPQDRPGSLNDVPQPEGDWEENYHKKQSKYNAALAGAAIFFVGTLTYVSNSFHFNCISNFKIISFSRSQILQSEVLFFNAFPPDTYE